MDFYRSTKGSPGPVGFDTETTSSFITKVRGRQEVSLIQLATQDVCLFFQIYNIMGLKQRMTLPFPPRLKAFLEDPNQLMCGVGTNGDSACLRKDYGILCKGLVELSKMTAKKKKSLKSLAALDGVYGRPGREVYKTKKILSWNWDKEVLQERWIWYAAKDAFAGVAIYENLISGTPKPAPVEDHRLVPLTEEEERTVQALSALTKAHGIGKVIAPHNQYWFARYFVLKLTTM